MDLKGLPADLAHFVQQELAHGTYQSADDLVAEAVRVLKDRETARGACQPTHDARTAPSTPTPDDIVHAIRQALATGEFGCARQLAMDGATRYPAHQELQQCARVLAPPTVPRVGRTQTAAARANRAWLKAHWHEHIGQWVAVRDGQFVHVALSFDQLVTHLDDPHGLLLTKIH